MVVLRCCGSEYVQDTLDRINIEFLRKGFDVSYAYVSNVKIEQKGKCIWSICLVPKDQTPLFDGDAFKRLAKEMKEDCTPMQARFVSCGLFANDKRGIIVRYLVSNCKGHSLPLFQQPNQVHDQPTNAQLLENAQPSQRDEQLQEIIDILQDVPVFKNLQAFPPTGQPTQEPLNVPHTINLQTSPSPEQSPPQLDTQQFTVMPQELEGKLSDLDVVFLDADAMMAIIYDLGPTNIAVKLQNLLGVADVNQFIKLIVGFQLEDPENSEAEEDGEELEGPKYKIRTLQVELSGVVSKILQIIGKQAGVLRIFLFLSNTEFKKNE